MKLVIGGILLLALLVPGIVAGSASHCTSAAMCPQPDISTSCAAVCEQMANTLCPMTIEECQQVSGACAFTDAPASCLLAEDVVPSPAIYSPVAAPLVSTGVYAQPVSFPGCTMDAGTVCGPESACMTGQDCTGVGGCSMTGTASCYAMAKQPVSVLYGTGIPYLAFF